MAITGTGRPGSTRGGREVTVKSGIALHDLSTSIEDLMGDNVSKTTSNNNVSGGLSGRQFHESADVPVTQLDLERVIGYNDLMGIAYLSRGLQAAKSVGNILIRDPNGRPQGSATGFMISPRLLLTNRHVFGKAEDAESSLLVFDYEKDDRGILKPVTVFGFDPKTAFITAAEDLQPDLDFAICAVKELDETNQTPLSAYGYLRLDSQVGKVVEQEYITIIQHPNGEPKQIALRENMVIEKAEKRPVLLYKSDTAPGSSGSPCFNDQWQVVALHAAGVSAEDRPDLASLASDAWVANLGVRISSIFDFVADAAPENKLLKDLLLDVQRGGAAIVPPKSVPRIIQPRQANNGARGRRASEARRLGYDPYFLGPNNAVPLPQLTARALNYGQPAVDRTTGETELTYTHFSVVHNASRRLAFLSAVNIDGTQELKVRRGDDFRLDSRIPKEEQAANWLVRALEREFA